MCMNVGTRITKGITYILKVGLNMRPKGKKPRSPLLKIEFVEIVLVFG